MKKLFIFFSLLCVCFNAYGGAASTNNYAKQFPSDTPLRVISPPTADASGSLTNDGVGNLSWSAGGSQTPWGSNINGGGYTLSNAKIQKRVDSSQTGVTTINVNSDSYDEVSATDTAISGTLTISADTGTGQSEGQSLLIKVQCTNTQTLSWTTGAKGFNAGSLPLPVSTTGSGKYDWFAFIWNSVSGEFVFTGAVYGTP